MEVVDKYDFDLKSFNQVNFELKDLSFTNKLFNLSYDKIATELSIEIEYLNPYNLEFFVHLLHRYVSEETDQQFLHTDFIIEIELLGDPIKNKKIEGAPLNNLTNTIISTIRGYLLAQTSHHDLKNYPIPIGDFSDFIIDIEDNLKNGYYHFTRRKGQ